MAAPVINFNDYDIFVTFGTGFNQLVPIHPTPGRDIVQRARIAADRLNPHTIR
jgi:hypothetical protein